jgi:hypothetical protein
MSIPSFFGNSVGIHEFCEGIVRVMQSSGGVALFCNVSLKLGTLWSELVTDLSDC